MRLISIRRGAMRSQWLRLSSMKLTWIGTLLLLFLTLPFFFLLFVWFTPEGENWGFIRAYWLVPYALHSFILSFGSMLFSMALGTLFAWWQVAYTYPGRKLFFWGLLMPLTIPPYIAAFIYGDLVSYTGWIPHLLDKLFGLPAEVSAISLYNMPGAIFIYTLFLYPYVFMIVRADLLRQDLRLIEAARLLGAGPLRRTLTVILPLARPAILSGGLLVAFEVLSDYGLASHFGLTTLSTGIFQSWFGMADLPAAMRLASIFLMISVMMLTWDRLRKRRVQTGTSRPRPYQAKKARGGTLIVIYLVHGLFFLLTLILPLARLTDWLIKLLAARDTPSGALTFSKMVHVFREAAVNTFALAFLSAVIIALLALFLSTVARHESNFLSRLFPQVALAGYSIPGAVVAIGVLALLLPLEHFLLSIHPTGWPCGNRPCLSGTPFMLLYAYLVRYLAVGYSALSGASARLGRRYMEAARLLGLSPWQAFFRVEWPLLRPAMFAAIALTMIDLVKELPLALILRPFDFNTLATRAFQYASDERLAQAAPYALLIIAVSFLSVVLLGRTEQKV
ncbi:MAG: Ferric iron ABC transporter, permease protein [Candidatus Carbobacillus altaicus]|uniref:Ferric iron ABC transporter, permease protein n=1 Tax=Candidatus Carbonibacillus altaicus TaxID=2163959 RepID=A0A2R6XXC4_9BACL|nr:MAG: Ferric iron ABC transporter, permease protein [Candidatus Carbobacillus altaicus]